MSFSYKNTIISSTMYMDRLEGKLDIKEGKPKDFTEDKKDREIEGVYKIEVNNNIAFSRLDVDNISDEIKNYAIEVSNRNSDEGFIKNYIYKIRKFRRYDW